MLLDLPEVAPGGQENPKQVGVPVVQSAELAGREDSSQLTATGATAKPGHGELVTAHRAVTGGAV